MVLGIPRGGVVVAAEVARELALPLGVALVRKLGAPSHEEFAVGAIAEGVRIVDTEALRHGGVTPEELAAVEDAERAELARRSGLFESSPTDVRERTAIVGRPAVARSGTRPPGAFISTSVSGPGQNFSASRSQHSFQAPGATISRACAAPETCAISGLSAGRPFKSYTRSIACALKVHAPRP